MTVENGAPGWRHSPLADLAEVAIGPFGSSLTRDLYVESGMPVVSGGNLRGMRWPDLEDAPHVTNETAQSLARSVAAVGDLVFPHRGAIGRVAIAHRPMMLSTSMMRARFNPDAIDREFAYWYFVYEGNDRLLTMASSVGTPGIGQPLASLRSVVIRYPELRKQQAIAEVLGALDDKIAANRQASVLTKELLAAHWESAASSGASMAPLADMVEISPRVPTQSTESAPYLDMRNLPEHGLLVADWAERPPQGGARFTNGDTLVARITPCFENGKIAWVDFLSDGEIGYGSTEYIVLRARHGVPPLAPWAIASTTRFREFAARHRTGTSGRQRVQASELGAYMLEKPTPDGLAAFGAIADPLVRRSAAARTENLRLAATRDELLPLLMSGRITVKDAEQRLEGEL